MAVRDGGSVVSIDQVIGSSTVTTMNWVGQRTPMHATSAGKVFLASMTPGELEQSLAGGLQRYTERTIVDATILTEQLKTVRSQGYAQTLEEHEIGLAAVAAPIRALDGQVIAALTVSGPNFRVSEQTIPGMAVRADGRGCRDLGVQRLPEAWLRPATRRRAWLVSRPVRLRPGRGAPSRGAAGR